MKLVAKNGCGTGASPAISTSMYGYRRYESCQEIMHMCDAEAEQLGMSIKLAAFDHETADCLLRCLQNTAHYKRRTF